MRTLVLGLDDRVAPMVSSLLLLLLLMSVLFAKAGSERHDNTSKLLFFDGRWVAAAANISAAAGNPRLLTTFRDPSSFTGWGYPSVWARRDGKPGWHMAYNGDFGGQHYPRIVSGWPAVDINKTYCEYWWYQLLQPHDPRFLNSFIEFSFIQARISSG